MKKTLGFFAIFISAIFYGSFGVWVRILNSETSIYQQLILRNGFSVVIAVLIVLLAKQFRNIKWKKIKKLNLFLYALLLPLSGVTYCLSMINTKIVLATFAFYVGVIITGWFAGLIFYKEKLNAGKWLSLILVLTGLFLFAYPFSSKTVGFGFIMGVVSGILEGSANGFRKDLAGKLNKFVLALIAAIGSVLVSGLMMVHFHQNMNYLWSISPKAWILGGFLGALLVVLNYLLLFGFQNFELSLGSIVLSLELLFALLFGILAFKEFPTTKEIVGGVFILMANIVPNIKMLVAKKTTKIS